MARRPFLLNPPLNSNYDVMNLYTSRHAEESESVTFARPVQGAFEFQGTFKVRLYTAPAFPQAAKQVAVPRMIADVQGRVFWPDPSSVESAVPARLMILHGTPAMMVRAPSKIVVEIPAHAASFTGYFAIPEEAYAGDGSAQSVAISIEAQDQSGRSQSRFDRVLRPLSRAECRQPRLLPGP